MTLLFLFLALPFPYGVSISFAKVVLLSEYANFLDCIPKIYLIFWIIFRKFVQKFGLVQ